MAALAIGLCVATLDAAAGKPIETPRLTVIVNDYAGASPAVLELAKSHVTFIYRAAGVDVDWMDHGDPRLDDQELLKSLITVTLYSSEMANRFADPEWVVGKAPPGGRTVKVFYDRLSDIRSGHHGEAGFLLGNVIAHEIGHLVLPGAPHSPIGLMADEMTISVATTRPLFFTQEQGRIIRSALAAAADNH